MYIVGVTIHVVEDHLEEFIEATRLNYEGTRNEPGNLRFDVLQSNDDKTRFFLYEVYKTQDDFSAHQQTPHYQQWRDTVNDWMAEKRQGAKYTNLFPGDSYW